MKRFLITTFATFMLVAIFSCAEDSNTGRVSSDVNSNNESTVELIIQNESSYDLVDVSWHGITFSSNIDKRTLASGSVAKNSVEKNAEGYVYFTRCGDIPAKLRSVGIIAASSYADRGYHITDNTLVAEIGNTNNTSSLANITLSAPDYYIVSFVSNGGTYIEPYTVLRGKEITVAPAMQMDGVAFAGWYSDAEFMCSVKFPFCPEADTVLYAEWKSPPESVSFTGSRISSSCVEIQITPSDDKYFDCYRVVCYTTTSVTSRTVSRVPSSKLVLDTQTKDIRYQIHGPDSKYSIYLYVVDKFGQESEAYQKSL